MLAPRKRQQYFVRVFVLLALRSSVAIFGASKCREKKPQALAESAYCRHAAHNDRLCFFQHYKHPAIITLHGVSGVIVWYSSLYSQWSCKGQQDMVVL